MAAKAGDDGLVILLFTIVPKGRSRRKSKNLVDNKWERSYRADKEEIFFTSFMRGGAFSQELNF